MPEDMSLSSLLLLLLSLVVICTIRNGTEHKDDIQESENVVCIPQDYADIILQCDDRRTTDTRRVCCYRNSSVIEKMYLKLVEAKKDMSIGSESGGRIDIPEWLDKHDSNHVYGPHDQEEKLVWTNLDTLKTTNSNNRNVRGNRIQTPTGGIYYAYSAFTFKLNNTREVPMGYHRIVLTEPTGGAKILEEKVFGGLVHESNTFSTFIDGKFKLLPGQMVGLEVYSESKVTFGVSPYANCFGCIKCFDAVLLITEIM